MSARSRLIPVLLVSLSALALGACRAPDGRSFDPQPELPATEGAAPIDTASPIMRSYEAPPGRAEELASVLQRVLSSPPDVPALGKARAIDGDRVIVVASAGIHEGVEHLCAQLKQQGSVAARSIEISYWLVHATPAEHTDVSAIPELDTALQEIAAVAGPTMFTLYERATLASTLNAEAKTSGSRAEFQQVATAHEGGIVADVDIQLRTMPGQLETRISVTPGKTIVIGCNGVQGDDARLFYVLRAELVDAA